MSILRLAGKASIRRRPVNSALGVAIRAFGVRIYREISVSREVPAFLGLTPYLHYEDLTAAIAWLTRVFGFVEKGRWQDEQGNATNAEMLVGATELWLDGTSGWWAKKGRQPEEWIGVWVTDLDALYKRITECGIDVAPPQHKFYGVRMLQVTDPEGYAWGFMQRAPFLARSPK